MMGTPSLRTSSPDSPWVSGAYGHRDDRDEALADVFFGGDVDVEF